MEGMVFTKIYDPPSINRKEILRYAGVYGDFPEADVLVDSCIKESEKAFSYKVCFAHFPVRHDGEYIDLGFAKTNSANLRKNLEGYEGIISLEVKRIPEMTLDEFYTAAFESAKFVKS